MKVLIVEDDPIHAKILEEYLVEAGYDIVVTKNGKEGLEALEEVQTDIVLLDRMMPEMDGIQFMEKLNKHKDLRDVLVIMQTAAADVPEVIEGAQTGVYYYLTKPYTEELLLSVVRAASEKVKEIRSLS